MAPLLIDMMPVHMRTSGFALAYSLVTAVFGGFTPAVCTYLIHITGNRAIPRGVAFLRGRLRVIGCSEGEGPIRIE